MADRNGKALLFEAFADEPRELLLILHNQDSHAMKLHAYGRALNTSRITVS